MGTMGKRLRRLRGDRKQMDIAKAVGIHNSVLSRMESDDKKSVDPSSLKRLAEFYGVTTDYLLTGNTPGFPMELEDSEELRQIYEELRKLDVEGTPEQLERIREIIRFELWKLKSGMEK